MARGIEYIVTCREGKPTRVNVDNPRKKITIDDPVLGRWQVDILNGSADSGSAREALANVCAQNCPACPKTKIRDAVNLAARALDLPQDSSPQQLTEAKKRMLKDQHPDIPGNTPRDIGDLMRALEILKDPKAMKAYEEMQKGRRPLRWFR